MGFTYPTKVKGSNFEPIGIRVRVDGQLLATTGVVVTCSVKDADSGVVIVTDGVAMADTNRPGVWRYWFTAPQVDAIEGFATWHIEWSIQTGGQYVWRSAEPDVLPVRDRQ